MSLHLVPDDDDERLVAVRRLDHLVAGQPDVLGRVVELAARLLEMPMAAITVVDFEDVRCIALLGFDLGVVERVASFCSAAILDEKPFVVRDATADTRVSSSPMVTGPFGLRFYAGVPLASTDGHRLGTLCVMDQRPRELSEGALTTLESLAGIAQGVLRLQERHEHREVHLAGPVAWEAPPPPKARSAEDWAPLLETVAQRPGEWAKIRHYNGETSAYRAARQLEARNDLPSGRWEFVVRRADGGSDLYARVTGDAPTA